MEWLELLDYNMWLLCDHVLRKKTCHGRLEDSFWVIVDEFRAIYRIYWYGTRDIGWPNRVIPIDIFPVDR